MSHHDCGSRILGIIDKLVVLAPLATQFSANGLGVIRFALDLHFHFYNSSWYVIDIELNRALNSYQHTHKKRGKLS